MFARWRVLPLTSSGETSRSLILPPTAGQRGRKAATASHAGPSSSLPTAHCLLPTTNSIGLVGPMSNYAAPPQLVEDVPYRDMGEMHGFARRWRDEHRGQWFTVPKLSGFCLLMKRAVYDKIGGLDERFGIGFFDDDDLAERARRAGFELAVAHDLFVHHFGSRTFAGNGVDAEKLLDENARRFAAKWGLAQPNGKRVRLRPWVGQAFQPDTVLPQPGVRCHAGKPDLRQPARRQPGRGLGGRFRGRCTRWRSSIVPSAGGLIDRGYDVQADRGPGGAGGRAGRACGARCAAGASTAVRNSRPYAGRQRVTV